MVFNKLINNPHRILTVPWGTAISAVCFPTAAGNPLVLNKHWLGVPHIQLNSDSVHVKRVSYPTCGIDGLGPTGLLPL